MKIKVTSIVFKKKKLIESFNEYGEIVFGDNIDYDYNYIIQMMSEMWQDYPIHQLLKKFEDSEYFNKPQDNDDYISQFKKYMLHGRSISE